MVVLNIKGKFDSNLNRHAVIHGLDVNFGTEKNSLKAFSLLYSVSDFENRYKKTVANTL